MMHLDAEADSHEALGYHPASDIITSNIFIALVEAENQLTASCDIPGENPLEGQEAPQGLLPWKRFATNL